jgi:hypothetical protein
MAKNDLQGALDLLITDNGRKAKWYVRSRAQAVRSWPAAKRTGLKSSKT